MKQASNCFISDGQTIDEDTTEHAEDLPCDSEHVRSFLQAASDGNLTQIQFVLDQDDLDVNVKDSNGTTALHLAALEGHLPVVEYLVI